MEEAFNNPGWWDDTSDGWVQAIVTIAGRQITADQAWVVVTPPKYAPELDSPVSLFDRLWDLFGLADTNAIPSYTHDIAPILRRPVPMGAVSEPAAHHHGWPDPAYHFYLRRKIAAWLRNGPYDDDPMKMPQLSSMERADQQFVSLTATQLAHVKRWRRGQFRQDWTGPGTPVEGLSPTGLDRAALEACVGDSFSPGIEAGAFFVDLKNWAAPYGTFRFASTVSPGDVTANMALPWQADFKACGSNWWPVPRPNEVIPEADPDSPHQDWTRGWADDLDGMVEHWHELGFVQSDGQGRFRETDRRPGPPSTPPDLADGQHTTLPLTSASHPRPAMSIWRPSDTATSPLALHTPGRCS